jgi:hypothetical protein
MSIQMPRLIKESFKIITDLKDHNDDDILIVSSHYSENLDWLKNSDKDVVVCSKVNDSPLCQQEANKGDEATAYLKFIIDNYNNLPKYIAFIHGHESGWHQIYPNSLMELIFEKAKYKEYDYIPLNGSIFDNIWYETKKPLLTKYWDEFFRPYLKRDIPDRLSADCCAQFIISRNAIKKYPKIAYENWYTIIINSEEDDLNIGKEHAQMFEYIWHIIYGENDLVSSEEFDKRFNF